MSSNLPPQRAKITVKVWAPIYDALVQRTEAACLRRDLLVTRTLALELPRIRQELAFRNSAKDCRYLEASLKTLFSSSAGAKQISLALSPEVAGDLEALCEDKNIPRETILNRLFMLLGAAGSDLDEYFLGFTPLVTKPTRFEDFFNSLEPEDIRTLAGELTKASAGSDRLDSALTPLGRAVSIVSDPLLWFRTLLQQRFHQQIEFLAATGDTKRRDFLETQWMLFTPFGVLIDGHPHLAGMNCFVPVFRA